jgi:hypothetical protein
MRIQSPPAFVTCRQVCLCLCLWLPGCGDSEPSRSPPDAASGTPVAVTVLTDRGDGVANTGAIAIFVDDHDQLVHQGFVGPMARAQAELPRGGTVHTLQVTQTSATTRAVKIVSIRGARPGDSLIVGAARRSRATGFQDFVTARFDPVGNATPLEMFHPCGTQAVTSGEASLVLYSECVGTSFDLLTTVSGEPPLVPLYAWAAINTLVSRSVAVPPLRRMPSFTITLQNAALGEAIVVERATLLPPSFDAPGAVQRTSVSPGGPAGGTISLNYPDSLRSLTAVRVVMSAGELEVRLAGTVGSAAIDLASQALPVVETQPMFAGAVVSWRQSGPQPGAGPVDARMVTAHSTHVTGGVTYAVDWTVFDNATAPATQLPGLPAMFADYDPTQQPAATPGLASVRYVNYSNVAGFDGARRLPLEELFAFGRGNLFGNQQYTRRISGR